MISAICEVVNLFNYFKSISNMHSYDSKAFKFNCLIIFLKCLSIFLHFQSMILMVFSKKLGYASWLADYLHKPQVK